MFEICGRDNPASLLSDIAQFFTVVDSDNDNMTKEVVPLTFVTSDQQRSEVNNLSCSHGNMTSSYHNITFLRVPIAESESESDCDTPDSEDEEDEEENKNHSQVNV